MSDEHEHTIGADEITPESEIPQCALLIRFDSPSSVNFRMESVGLSAFQLLMLSQYFEILGKNALAQQAEEQRMKRMEELARTKIVTPQDVRRIERV